LREDHAAWRLPRDMGQLSLAGAQPKTAFFCKRADGAFHPDAHPKTADRPFRRFVGHAENEHICLLLARKLGMPVADTKVMRFEVRA
jgi:serine/threonine-protein kinase HipA